MTNKRKSGVSSPQMLTRSRIEIARVLGALTSARSAVSTYLESGELLFYAHIREVDAAADRVVMNYGVSKPANTVLLSRKKISFHNDHGNMHIKFLAVSPVHNKYDGESAIQLRFPDYLVQHEQRSQPRIKIPS
jgi:hypothetical protein